MASSIRAAAQARVDKKLGKGTMANDSYPINSQHQADSAFKLRGRSKKYSSAQVMAHIRSEVASKGFKMPGGS